MRPPFFWAGETATPPGCLCPGEAALGDAVLGAGLGRTRVGGDVSTLLCDGVLVVGGAGVCVTPPDGGVPGAGTDAGAPVAGEALGAGAGATDGAEGAAGAGALLVCAATALAAAKLAAIVKPNKVRMRPLAFALTRVNASLGRTVPGNRNRSPDNAFSVHLNPGDAR